MNIIYTSISQDVEIRVKPKIQLKKLAKPKSYMNMNNKNLGTVHASEDNINKKVTKTMKLIILGT